MSKSGDRARKTRDSRRAAGLCEKCGLVPPRENRFTCIFCSMANSGRGSEREKRYVQAGLCRKCSTKKHAENRTMCEGCLEKCRVRALAHYRAKKIPALAKVLEHYGHECACCGETEPKFLTIDHVNNDGAFHRKTVGSAYIAQWLVENDFPEGFQLLCFNCNCGRHRNGGVCPHAQRS